MSQLVRVKIIKVHDVALKLRIAQAAVQRIVTPGGRRQSNFVKGHVMRMPGRVQCGNSFISFGKVSPESVQGSVGIINVFHGMHDGTDVLLGHAGGDVPADDILVPARFVQPGFKVLHGFGSGLKPLL